jgi:TonB family protein
MKDYRTYPYPVNFIRLRPELIFFIFLVLFSVIFFTRWNIKTVFDDFVDLSRFEMVELEIPVQEFAEPDIATPDEAAEDAEEEKKETKEEKLKFGDDSGHYDLSALSVVPPKPRVAALPPYPDSVRKLGIEGIIVTEIGIDENGAIVYAKIVKKLHPVLNKIVIEWIRNISFYPAIDQDGKPFRCKIFWPIRFQLTD